MPTTHLAETLWIEGPDAVAFAHAQFSSKVSSLEVGQWQFSAWLDPKGRVRALFHLARVADDRLFVLLRGGDAATVVDALRRFVFRSRLTLTAASPQALATGTAMPMHAVHDDAGTISLGCGTHSMRMTGRDNSDETWHLPQLHAGWPWLPAPLSGELLPASLSLQRLQAVAVDKGCYPGQEIVARLHFRGGHKRHMHRVILSQTMPPGEVLRSEGHEVGCVLDTNQSGDAIEALVVLHGELAPQAAGAHGMQLDGQLTLHIEASWPA